MESTVTGYSVHGQDKPTEGLPVNRRPNPKRASESLRRFREDPKLGVWKPSIRATSWKTLHYSMWRVLGNILPGEFLQRLDSDPKTTKIWLKGRLTELAEQAGSTVAKHGLIALRNFAAYHEQPFELNGYKISRESDRPRPEAFLTWAQVEQIIEAAHPTYRPALEVMLWGGLDLHRFVQINNDPAMIESVKSQLSDPKRDHVTLDVLKGRKKGDKFRVFLPRHIAEKLPLKGGRGPGNLRAKGNIQYAFREAARRLGLYQLGLGVHELRDTFRTEATKRGLPEPLAEHQLGHRDPLGYEKSFKDIDWALQHWRKFWYPEQTAIQSELERLRLENERLRDELERSRKQTGEELEAFRTNVVYVERQLEEQQELTAKLAKMFDRGSDKKISPKMAKRFQEDAGGAKRTRKPAR